MKIFLSPQVSNHKICYKFEGEKIIATLDNITDEFDFSNVPNGVLYDVKTSLRINPIISARREDGELWVELINFIDEDATEEERFPEWQEV